MLTPQEVAEHTFSKAKFGAHGYTMQEVDDFLDQITRDYTALSEENVSLKGKLKVLAEKIGEYRETEDIMRATLHNAQKTANEIVSEAESKREAILDALEQDIRARKQAYDDEIAACRAQLAEARARTTEYVAMLQDLTDQQQAFLASLPDLGQGGDVEEPAAEEVPEEPAEEPEAPAEAAEAEAETAPAEDSIGEMIAEEAEPAPEEPAAEELRLPKLEEQPTSGTSRIDFSHLKFGKDYEIK